MHPALRALLTETVQHAAYASRDAYGQMTYGTPVARPARIEYGTAVVTNRQGEDVITHAKVFMAGDFTLRAEDALTLPDGTTPPIIRLAPWTDTDGLLHHYEIYL